MKKIMSLLPVLLFAAAALVGCGAAGGKHSDAETKYQIYYINHDETRVVGTDWYTEETDQDSLIWQMLQLLKEAPEDVDLSMAIPDGVSVEGYTIESGQLSIYFGPLYSEIEANKEILVRAAIVKTLTQLDFVDFVGFYINGQPLTDVVSGAIALMSEASFVDVDSADYQEIILTLYYANESGTSLIETEQIVSAPINKAKEELIVEELIRGPESEGLYPVLSNTIQIISVTTKNGTCYLNLDSSFLKDSTAVEDSISIFALVNSLTELPSINKVQISVEGSSGVSFRDRVPLEQPFERKMDLVDPYGIS